MITSDYHLTRVVDIPFLLIKWLNLEKYLTEICSLRCDLSLISTVSRNGLAPAGRQAISGIKAD